MLLDLNQPIDLTQSFGDPKLVDASLSDLARGVIGSEILRIAGQIRALKAQGATICNLTVGDFDPAIFPIPASLLEGVRAALAGGNTNYPPSDGMLSLREAVARFYERELHLHYPVESVLIAGGARPLLYGSYRTILDPGDLVLYPVPSWNNNHYTYLMKAKGQPIIVRPEDNFFPTVEQIQPYLASARLLLINSPLNPTGTVISAEQLEAIGKAIVEENRRREKAGAKALWLVYDQVYWPLVFGTAKHVTPVGLIPELAPWTIMLDAASKSFAATGMRVGWAVMPPQARQRMADVLGHVGAWAPKAEQVAMAALLDNAEEIHAFWKVMMPKLNERLNLLSEGFNAMAADGYTVEALKPQGAIYLSARIVIPGKTNEEVRKLVLEKAGLAIIPFQAFGLKEETGWFRLSVGAVSIEDIQAAFPRLREALPRG